MDRCSCSYSILTPPPFPPEPTLATPGGFSVTVTGPTEAAVDWGTVEHATAYRLEVWMTSNPGQKETYLADAPPVVLGGLSPATNYTMSVIAVDDSGAYLDSRPAMDAFTTDALPALAIPGFRDLVLVDANTVRVVTHSTQQTAPQGVRITVNPGGYSHDVPQIGNSADFPGLETGELYSFHIVAIGDGTTTSDSAPFIGTFTVGGKLAPPTNVQAVADSPTQLTVTWDAAPGSDDYGTYLAYGESGTVIGGTEVTSPYVYTGLTPGTTYTANVYSVGNDMTSDPNGPTLTLDSDPAAAAPVTMPSPPPQLAAPTGLASPSQTDTSVDLTWAAVADATGYVVQWSPAGAGTWTALAQVTATAATVTGLSSVTSYDFQVKASAPGYVDSPWSATLTQSTAAALLGPTGFAVDGDPTSTSVGLLWNADAFAQTYTVAWALLSSDTWTDVAPVSTTSTTVTGLSPSTQYKFRIKSSRTGFADSPWSSPLPATTAASQLAMPVDLQETNQTQTSATLSWDAVPNADRYLVTWIPQGDPPPPQSATVTGTSHDLTGLTADTIYNATVTAQDSTGTYADSPPGTTVIQTSA